MDQAIHEQLRLYNADPSPESLGRLQEVLGLATQHRACEASLALLAAVAALGPWYDEDKLLRLERALHVLLTEE